MKNKKLYLTIFISVILIFILNLILETNVFGAVYRYITDKNYQQEITALYEQSYYSNIFTLAKNWFNNYEWKFDYIMIWASQIFQMYFPILLVGGAILYKKLVNKENLKDIFKFTTNISLIIFLSFLVFYFSIYFITNGQTSYYITRGLFQEFFGSNFYHNHVYLYYFLEGIIKFFIIPFFYISIGILTSYFYKNKLDWFKSIIFILLFMLLFVSGITSLVGDVAAYFNPSTIFIASTYDSIYISVIILMYIALLIILIWNFKTKKLNFKNFNSLIICPIFYIVLLIFVIWLNKEVTSDTIKIILQSPFFIISYISIFNTEYFKLKKINRIKSIEELIIKHSISTILYIAIIFILSIIFKYKISSELIMFFIEFLLTQIIISLFILIITYDKKLKYKGDNYLIGAIAIFYLLYIYTYMYYNNIWFINLYRYYYESYETSNLLLHNIFWISITFLIIYFKFYKKGSNYVRIKKHKQNISNKEK